MKLRTALMICTALIMPTTAAADPVTAFFTALAGGTVTAAAAASAIGGLTAFAYSAGTFFGSTLLGSLILNVGLAYLLTPKQSAPKIDAARVNSRIPDAPRWQLAGTVAVGGEVGPFGEYDEDGNFWYIVAHGDAELTGDPSYILDGIEVELSDGTDGFTEGDVITDDFCLTDAKEQYEGTGTQVPYFRLYTVTPDSSSAYGTLPGAFTTAFTNLPSDFRLAGVCFTIVRCKSIEPANYGKVYRWRGAIGLGEPSVNVVANFNRMYDPRVSGIDIDDSTTWPAGDGNPVIVWAWFRTAPYGRNRPMSEINWTKVAAAASACDETVLDRSAESIPRYRCGVAFPDNKPRHECEGEILLTCDGFVAYDDEGKAYPVVGVYEAPTLSFTAERDILSAQTMIVDDGEAAVDGVVVDYVSPDHGYTKQSAAPWQNTEYYDGTSEPNYLRIDVLGCQNHNQAVRLAKAIGLRSASTKRASLATNIKGILAKGQRTIDLSYDANFTGDYEIVEPVREDASGMSCGFSVVPMQSDRYDLDDGEEGAPPAITPALSIDTDLVAASNVVLTAAAVSTSSGAAVRIEATFDAPSRADRAYRFRYAVDGTTVYEYMFVDMDELTAYSAVVSDGVVYDVSYQTVTGGGRGSDWSAVTEVTATANPTAPIDLVSTSTTGGTGEAVLEWTTGNDANQSAVEVRRGTTTVLGDATLVSTVLTGPNDTQGLTDTIAAGTYYYWYTPINGSGVQGTDDGPNTATVS